MYMYRKIALCAHIIYYYIVLQAYDKTGRFKFKYGSFGTKPQQLRKPGGVAFDEHDRIYVTDTMNWRVHVLSPDGKLLCHVMMRKSCGKMAGPPPDMCAVTRQGDLLLANEDGWVKILKLTF